MMPAKIIALIIARAALKREKDLTLTFEDKMVVWLYKNFPSITALIILH
jgi:hypothetical protein